MAVALSPVFNGWQGFAQQGIPLSAGKLYTYAAGTVTPLATYTTSSGSIANTNPIILDAGGRPPQEIWLTVGPSYKFVLQDSLGNLIGTYDDIPGVEVAGTSDTLRADLASSAVDKGSKLVAFIQRLIGAVARTVENRLQDTVHVFDFMTAAQIADVKLGAAAVLDCYGALQAALDTGSKVYMPGRGWVYNVTQTPRFKASGQILFGEGAGDSSVGTRAKIRYTGSAGGKIISFANGSGQMMQNCRIQDLALDGNALANIGVEGYDDAITGGAWRNGLSGVFISGVTNGATPTNVYLGTTGAAPSFAHDFLMHRVYMYGGAVGVAGKGAIHTMSGKCTVQGMTTAGVVGYAGSAWALGDTVFTGNVRDIDVTNVQLVSASGAWFENSTAGIYRAATAHCLVLDGCYLHTSNAALMFDMGSAAGDFTISGNVSPTAASTLVTNINSLYDFSVLGSRLTTSIGVRQRTVSLTRADQSAFAAGPTADTANATGDGTAFNLNATAFTAEYNLGANFAVASGIFTAPVDGNYEFTGRVSLGALGAAHTDCQVNLIAGGQSYLLERLSPGAARTASNEAVFSGTVTVTLAAAATAYLQVTVSGSTKTVTVASGGAGTNWRTRFQGRLV